MTSCNDSSLGKLARLVAIALAVAFLATTSSAIAQITIIDSLGFENPPYVLGDLEGQEGWLATLAPTSTAEVQNAVALSGTQAVEVNRAAGSNDRFAVPTVVVPNAANPIINVDWDMRVEDAGGPAGAFGPYAAVEANDGFNGLGVLGSLGVDATTGEVLFQAQDTGFLTPAGPTVAFGTWNHFRMSLNFLTDEYTVSLNGVDLATTGFVDRALGLDEFTDAPITLLQAAGDAISRDLVGTAYYDNYVVTQIPEPTSVLLLSICGVAACALRRSRDS